MDSVLGNKLHAMEELITGLLCLGLLLLPFSTGKESPAGVVAWGLPLLALAAFLSLLHLLYQRGHFAVGARWMLLISSLYVTSMVTAAFFSPQVIPSLSRALVNVLGFLLFLFILSFLSADPETQAVLKARLVTAVTRSGVILSLYYLINMAFAVKTNGLVSVILDREVGGLMSLPWGASNTVAATLVIPFLVTMAAPAREGKSGAAKIAVVSLFTVAILATESRTVLFVALAAAFGYSFATRSFRPLVTLLVILSLALALIYLWDASAFNMFFEVRLKNFDTLTEGRAEIWSKVARYVGNNPLLPVGFYGSQYAFGSSGHNIVLTALAETGLIGLLCTLAMHFGLLQMAWASYRRNGNSGEKASGVFAIGVLGILANLLAEDPQFTQQYVIYYWTFAGLVSLFCARGAAGSENRRLLS